MQLRPVASFFAMASLVVTTLASDRLSFVKFELVLNEQWTCDYVCAKSHLHCMDKLMTTFSCHYAASAICGNSPYIHEYPSTTCTDGGGCFVHCEHNVYENIYRQNSSCHRRSFCTTNNYQICPCGQIIEAEESSIAVDPVQITGVSIFLMAMVALVLVLLYSCCTVKGTTKYLSGGDIELQGYVEQELATPEEQLKWGICCDPVLHTCGRCYDITKEAICCLPDSIWGCCYPVKMLCRYIVLGVLYCCCPKPKVEYVQLDTTVHAIDRNRNNNSQRVTTTY